jgi:hypothetical protein
MTRTWEGVPLEECSLHQLVQAQRALDTCDIPYDPETYAQVAHLIYTLVMEGHAHDATET